MKTSTRLLETLDTKLPRMQFIKWNQNMEQVQRSRCNQWKRKARERHLKLWLALILNHNSKIKVKRDLLFAKDGLGIPNKIKYANTIVYT